MSSASQIALIPLAAEWHVDALQQVYWATPGYWALYNLPAAPTGQAANDLRTAAETPGRTLLGIVRQADPLALESADPATEQAAPTSGGELVGLLDFRLHWPNEQVVSIGMFMVAEPYQRQGLGTQAWTLLKPWLAQQAQMQRARLGVEQFNPMALQFFESLGFSVTGEANRLKVGDKFVRLLYMEADLT
ncbi:MAG: GNAT family N-acetyltransferase [Caldilineaceae bacterium]|nr:GNAT family N-acetyltransferase [Caldilineaceae bacterium]